MGALSIAFDTIIVGALALPWVLLVIHLFSPENESRVGKLLDWVKEQNQPAVAGVLLFAMAYSLGSAVSRIAQDCFDDEDLRIQGFGHLFRVGLTETNIRTHVYCQEQGLIPQTLIDSLTAGPEQFRTTDPTCQYTGRWIVPQTLEWWVNQKEDLAGYIFHIQEGALLLKGTDANERLRQFHDQIMVLRGAAFNGLIAFSLCLFWWSTRFQSRLRWAVPSVYLFPGLIAIYHHLLERAAGDPPYMEFTLLVLAAAGWYVLWRRTPKGKGVPGKPPAQNGRAEIRAAYLVLSLFLTATASLGWWATEELYSQQVIYSYKALSESPTK